MFSVLQFFNWHVNFFSSQKSAGLEVALKGQGGVVQQSLPQNKISPTPPQNQQQPNNILDTSMVSSGVENTMFY